MISARHTHFLIAVANNDIYEHLGAVKDLRENRAHDLKHPLVVSLDYVSIPMAITMRSVTEHREHESRWDGTIQKVKAQGGPLVFPRHPHAVDPRESLLPKSTFELFQVCSDRVLGLGFLILSALLPSEQPLMFLH